MNPMNPIVNPMDPKITIKIGTFKMRLWKKEYFS